jgi:hypothetical protein
MDFNVTASAGRQGAGGWARSRLMEDVAGGKRFQPGCTATRRWFARNCRALDGIVEGAQASTLLR